MELPSQSDTEAKVIPRVNTPSRICALARATMAGGS
jgi:hypothetical protein